MESMNRRRKDKEQKCQIEMVETQKIHCEYFQLFLFLLFVERIRLLISQNKHLISLYEMKDAVRFFPLPSLCANVLFVCEFYRVCAHLIEESRLFCETKKKFDEWELKQWNEKINFESIENELFDDGNKSKCLTHTYTQCDNTLVKWMWPFRLMDIAGYHSKY